MGNKISYCLRPSASPRLGRRSRRVMPKCESEVDEVEDAVALQVMPKCECDVDEVAPRDAVALPASLKLEKLNFENSMGHHPENISNPEMAEERGKNKNNNRLLGRLTKEYRSCPTVFLYDDTISQLNFTTTIQSITLAIYHNIKYRPGSKSYEIFEETTHLFRHEIITKDHFLHDPELEVIYRFVCTLFGAEHLTAECAIVTLIYLERLLDYKDVDICATNWRRILLGATILAYEYWNKQAPHSVNYCQLINNIITVKDMNEIERDFLCLIQFDVNIPASVYARYYFDLRTLAQRNNLLALF